MADKPIEPNTNPNPFRGEVVADCGEVVIRPAPAVVLSPDDKQTKDAIADSLAGIGTEVIDHPDPGAALFDPANYTPPRPFPMVTSTHVNIPEQRRTLLAITEDVLRLSAMIEDAVNPVDGEIPVDMEPIIDGWLAQLEDARGDLVLKVDNYVALIFESELRGEAIKKEADRLGRLAASSFFLGDKLRGRLKFFLERVGIFELLTARYKLRIAERGGMPAVDLLVPVDQLPEKYKRVITEPNKSALAKDLKAGVAGVADLAKFAAKDKNLRIT